VPAAILNKEEVIALPLELANPPEDTGCGKIFPHPFFDELYGF